jgi:hypothetical protein
MAKWCIGNYVRPIGMRQSNDVYQIVGENENSWILYGHRFLGGGYHDGGVPKSVEFENSQGNKLWEKLANTKTIKRPTTNQFNRFMNSY